LNTSIYTYCPQNFGEYADWIIDINMTNTKCTQYCSSNFYDYAGTSGSYEFNFL